MHTKLNKWRMHQYRRTATIPASSIAAAAHNLSPITRLQAHDEEPLTDPHPSTALRLGPRPTPSRMWVQDTLQIQRQAPMRLQQRRACALQLHRNSAAGGTQPSPSRTVLPAAR